tara:strand:- start:1890 stop:2516 length:627 start_codon:yes stop_codon:yes gene_type:complete
MKNLVLGVLFAFGMLTEAYASNGFMEAENEEGSSTIYAGDERSLADEAKMALKDYSKKGFIFDQTPLTQEDLELIGARHDLETLSVVGCGLRGDDLNHFKALGSLQQFNISHNQLTVEDLRHLNLGNLSVFHCWGIPVEDRGIKALLKSVPNVRELNISACHLSDNSLEYLCMLPNLQKVFLKENNFSRGALTRFREKAREQQIEVVL